MTDDPTPVRRSSPSAVAALAAALAGLIALPAAGFAAPGTSADTVPGVPGDLGWRNIGPSNMMGRISAIDALDDDFRTVLVGTASGGVWKSTNAGTTVEPIFDEYGSQSIGDVKFFQGNPEIIWVGTGEASSRNSVGWGDGIYKSTDGGETFEHVGLEESYHIAEIAPHPTDPDVVYVAVSGALWSLDGVRGLFRTTDGGETWTKLTDGLPDDGRTGAMDVEISPEDPEVVYAGFTQRIRRPWAIEVGGPDGGLFKSTDGGDTWTELSGGLPTDTVGMTDIDLYRRNPEILTAFVGAPSEAPRDLSEPGPGVYRSEDGGETWTYQLRHTSRPHYHGQVRIDPSDSSRVYLVSRHFMYSDDGGETWSDDRPFSTGGGDDHDLWISPRDSDVMYSATDQGAHLTMGDGGHVSLTNMAIGQYYEIGVDGRDPYWIYGGLQDNGGWAVPNRSRNRNGVRMDHAVKVNGGDGFHMTASPADWRTVYSAVHVGYFGRIDMKTRKRTFITPTPATTLNFREHYRPDYPESQTEYTINPGEHWLWFDLAARQINGSILPPQFRWNWNPPMTLSPNSPQTVYVGANHVFRSRDRGETWRIVSPDLTENRPETRNSSRTGGTVRDATGAENHHTIYTIGESPVDPAVVWAGTDDGNVQVTRDGGDSWTNVAPNMPGLPEGLWVSHVEPSHHEAPVAYVAVDGHRSGDRAPYIYRTDDFGESWTRITDGIPAGERGNSVHVVVEDHGDPDLLFAGTEFGAYVSLDRGRTWQRFMEGLPPVAVRDLVIHPREDDLVAGTHGRSVWVADDISPLRALTDSVRGDAVHVFENPVATRWLDRTNYALRTSLKFNGENPPDGAAVSFWKGSGSGTDTADVIVRDPATGRRAELRTPAGRGLNRAYWDLSFAPAAEAVSAYRSRLLEVADHLEGRLRGAEVEGESGPAGPPLDLMADDILEPQRYPDRFENVDYPADDPGTDGPDLKGGEDDRRILLAHLGAVRDSLEAKDGSDEWRALNSLRSQLEALSPAAGDSAFTGLYPEPLSETAAGPGRYRVRVEIGGESARGSLRLREDPLKEE